MTALAEPSIDVRVLSVSLERWLESGIVQSQSGAYCAWREADTGKLAFEYPEITGYALTWLSSRAETPRLLATGRRAADWLVARFGNGDRSARAGWDGGTVYTFDLGMIAAGLLSFGAMAGEGRYLDLGRRLARELAAFVDSPRGLRAIAPDGPSTNRGHGWSTTGRPHLVKCAQALLLAGENEAAARLATATMRAQHSDGGFATQPGDDTVMLHPHLYTVEGLWMWGTATGRDDALRCALEATAFAWEHQLPSGGLPRYASFYGPGPEQFDVTSQAIRAAILTGLKPPGLQRAIARLASQAVVTYDGAALPYRPGAEIHLNAWVTMFGAQALALAGDGQAVSWKTLV